MADLYPKLKAFSPPGNLVDLSDANRARWSEAVSSWINNEITETIPGQAQLKQFFDGTMVDGYYTLQGVTITWHGFPLKIGEAAAGNDEKRWMMADYSRDGQDEYLEWALLRDRANNILRVTFTCESPEYWDFMAGYQMDTAIRNIRSLNAPLLDSVSDIAFFNVDPSEPNNRSGWSYRGNNFYNVSTILGTITHLVQPANTLGAAINTVAQATVLRKSEDGRAVTDPDLLIDCSGYGDPVRSSDPWIGWSINQRALQGDAVSLADPVGLYIVKFDTDNFRLDPIGDGDEASLVDIPAGTFVWQRGDITNERGLRLRVQIPDGVRSLDGQRQLTVSDIYDTRLKRHIRYGAQFADYIIMGVSVVINPGEPAPAEFGLDDANPTFPSSLPSSVISSVRSNPTSLPSSVYSTPGSHGFRTTRGHPEEWEP